MTDFSEPFDAIQDDFERREIIYDTPGFYDSSKFLLVERARPEYLSNYARFVQGREYSDEYLLKARQEIEVIARSLYNELLRDGRQGACVDMAGVLSRILEREGYWNFVIKGSLTIEFPPTSGKSKRYFWTYDEGEFIAGHAWVYAPPFKMIDLTLKQQPHRTGDSNFLPDYVLAEDTTIEDPDADDVISPTFYLYMRELGIPKAEVLGTIAPNLQKFWDTFNTYMVEAQGTKLKYVPTANAAPDCPLEDLIGISQGKSGIELYHDVVLPELEAFRA